MTELTKQEMMEVQRAERTVARRKLFARHLTDEVLEAMEELFGVRERMFAFRQVGGAYDPLDAMRTDTLKGAVAALRYERDHAAEAAAVLDGMRAAMKETEI